MAPVIRCPKCNSGNILYAWKISQYHVCLDCKTLISQKEASDEQAQGTPSGS